MAIQNVMEDVVFSSVQKMFDSIQKEGNPEGFCFCEQCRMDTACYVLNRSQPRYIVSNRGVARIERDGLEWQQIEADIATLIYEGLRRVKHNQRPNAHNAPAANFGSVLSKPVYSIPVIVGRIFDGATFAPLAGVTVELRSKGELVAMRDHNWQNPYTLVSNTAGTFTFWPAPVEADHIDDHKIFEFLVKAEAPQYETLTHFFKVPVVSMMLSAVSFSIDRTFKLPDIYVFPPGEAEQNG